MYIPEHAEAMCKNQRRCKTREFKNVQTLDEWNPLSSKPRQASEVKRFVAGRQVLALLWRPGWNHPTQETSTSHRKCDHLPSLKCSNDLEPSQKSNKVTVTSFLSNFSSLCQLSDKVHYSLWCQLSWPQGDHKNATSSHVASFLKSGVALFHQHALNTCPWRFCSKYSMAAKPWCPFQAFSHWMESVKVSMWVYVCFLHIARALWLWAKQIILWRTFGAQRIEQ